VLRQVADALHCPEVNRYARQVQVAAVPHKGIEKGIGTGVVDLPDLAYNSRQ
jgi:hypothetical protein